MEQDHKKKSAVPFRDTEGSLVVDADNNLLCICEDGLQFYIPKKNITADSGSLLCRVGDEQVELSLSDAIESEIENDTCVKDETYKATKVKCVPDENKENVFFWNDRSTRLFLSIYKEKKKLVTRRKIKTMKAMWQQIANEMAVAGYGVSPLQVENKFKTLERSYKNTISNNSKSGRGRATCAYESELAELLGSKHSILPLAVSSKEGLTIRLDATVPATTQLTPQPTQLIPYTEQMTGHAVHEMLAESQNCASTSRGTTGGKKRPMGTTAQILARCQESIESLNNERQQQKSSREEFEKDFRDFMKKMIEQRQIANEQRQRRNLLLEEVISLIKGKEK